MRSRERYNRDRLVSAPAYDTLLRRGPITWVFVKSARMGSGTDGRDPRDSAMAGPPMRTRGDARGDGRIRQ